MKATYAKLLHSTARVIGQAKRFADEVASGVKRAHGGILKQLRLEVCKADLMRMIPLVKQVMHQTRERLFKGNTHVPGKLVSGFEPHTEVTAKAKPPSPRSSAKW